MVVLKFGGTAVGNPTWFRNAVAIVEDYASQNAETVVIASALRGVTDRLVAVGKADGASGREDCLKWLYDVHHQHALLLLSETSQQTFARILSDMLNRSSFLIQAIVSGGNKAMPAAAARDELLAVGERLAVNLFASALADKGLPGKAVDAGKLIDTDHAFGDAQVNVPASNAKIQAWYATLSKPQIPVITGFIGRAPDGKTTTLGRGGSDYSASLLAAGLGAQKVQRWTDVDGIYTADPRRDPTARKLDHIIMEEAISWNKAGKMGLHRKTLDPLIEKRIALEVRCIDTPELPGTLVHPRTYRKAVAC